MRRGIAAWIAIASLFVVTGARADEAAEQGIVALRDGRILRGDVLESIRGDHVTIRVAGGDVERFAWGDVALVMSSPIGWRAFESIPAPTPSLRYEQPETPNADASEHVADAFDADSTPSPVPSSRLSLGVSTGYGSLLGTVGTQIAYWPVSWFGLEAGYGWHGSGGPTTFDQRLELEWTFGPVGQGLGVGLAESHVTRGPDGAPLASPGFVRFIDADVTHFSVYFSRAVMLRATLGMAFPVAGGSVCGEADAWSGSVCGGMTLSGTAQLFWSFDLGGGEKE